MYRTDLTCRPGLQTRRECPRQAGSSSSPSTSAPQSPTAQTDLQPATTCWTDQELENPEIKGSRDCRMSVQRCVGGWKWLQNPCCTLSSVIADCPRLPPGRSHGRRQWHSRGKLAGRICSRCGLCAGHTQSPKQTATANSLCKFATRGPLPVSMTTAWKLF